MTNDDTPSVATAHTACAISTPLFTDPSSTRPALSRSRRWPCLCSEVRRHGNALGGGWSPHTASAHAHRLINGGSGQRVSPWWHTRFMGATGTTWAGRSALSSWPTPLAHVKKRTISFRKISAFSLEFGQCAALSGAAIGDYKRAIAIKVLSANKPLIYGAN